MGSRPRIALMLALLAAAIVALVTSRSVFTTSARARRSGAPCLAFLSKSPGPTRVDLSQIVELRAGMLEAIAPLAERRYEYGTVSPEVAWTDDTPERLAAPVHRHTLYPATYEMRVWASAPRLKLDRTDTVADVFEFASPAGAQRFFTEASGTRCHRDGSAIAAARPRGARDLIWLNPDGATQEDVWMLRGALVYRIGETPRGLSPSPARAPDFTTVNTLACALPEAGCEPAREGI